MSTYRSEFEDDPIITKPDRIAGMRFSEHLNTQNWTDDLKNRLENALVYGPHETRCVGNWEPLTYPEIRQVYVEEDVCGADSGSGRNSSKFVQIISISALIVLLVNILNNM